MDPDRYQGSRWEPKYGDERCVKIERRGDKIYVRNLDVGGLSDIQITEGLRDTNPVPSHDVKIKISGEQDNTGIRTVYNAKIASYEACRQDTERNEKSVSKRQEASNPDSERQRDVIDDTLGGYTS